MSITGRDVSVPQGIPSEQELKPMMTDLEAWRRRPSR